MSTKGEVILSLTYWQMWMISNRFARPLRCRRHTEACFHQRIGSPTATRMASVLVDSLEKLIRLGRVGISIFHGINELLLEIDQGIPDSDAFVDILYLP